MKKIFAFITLALVLMLSIDVDAQCSMCKAVLESNMQNGDQSVGGGINSGILYIMFVPYLLLAGVGYFMYKHKMKTSNESSLK